MDKNKIYRIIIGVIVFIYIVSPVDMHAGPIDDIIITVIGYFVQKAVAKSENKN